MAMGRLGTLVTVFHTLPSTAPHVMPTSSAFCGWHKFCLTFPSNPVAPQGFTDILFKIQHAELGFLSELPLALCVRVVQLPRQFLRVLVFLRRLWLISEAGRLGRA